MQKQRVALCDRDRERKGVVGVKKIIGSLKKVTGFLKYFNGWDFVNKIKGYYQFQL